MCLLKEGLAQAKRYDESKPPLLVIKQKGMHGALVVMYLDDFATLFNKTTEEGTENVRNY